jgi:hypothetical protein
MNEDRIKELLTQADGTAGPASYGSVSAAGIRHRARQRQIRFVAFPATAAALLLLGIGLWNWRSQPPASTHEPGERIASLEEQIRQLQIQSAETLRLVREVVAAERNQQRLVALEDELASIGDPLEEMRRQANETAYVLLCQADRFYREMNQPQSAIDTYEQVIRVFPESPWADEARDRLAQIRSNRTNRT